MCTYKETRTVCIDCYARIDTKSGWFICVKKISFPDTFCEVTPAIIIEDQVDSKRCLYCAHDRDQSGESMGSGKEVAQE